jgi:4-hydroxysphinganine ceramide fatty acyl 2-hydroxylase
VSTVQCPQWLLANKLRLPPYYQELKKYHLKHHFADYQNGFGVTSRFWDWVFGTELEMGQPKVLKAT